MTTVTLLLCCALFGDSCLSRQEEGSCFHPNGTGRTAASPVNGVLGLFVPVSGYSHFFRPPWSFMGTKTSIFLLALGKSRIVTGGRSCLPN